MSIFNNFNLAIACYAGAENIVRYLIEHNVDVNQIDCSALKRSALHWAVAAKNFQIVKMLIDASIIKEIEMVKF
jgi:ankyrin repeat protein